MVQFSDFDSRGYRTVDVRTGYGEWVATYEPTVEDAMDVALLDALTKVPWRTLRRAADQGCGTPTHFTSGSGEPVAIATYVHLLSDHVTTALDTGWVLVEMRE